MSSKHVFAGTLVFGAAIATVTVSAIAQAQIRWDTQPGCLSQVAAGNNDLFGIGCGGSDQAIFRMPTSQVPNDSWTRLPGAAIQVSAGSDDVPWVVNSAGSIYRWNTSSASWNQQPGCAKSIAVGNSGNGQVWMIGCTFVSNGNYDVYTWNGSGWTQISGAARQISVLPGTTVPYVVTAQGLVYQWTGSAWSKQTWIPCATQFVPPKGQDSELGILTACGTNEVYNYQLAADGNSYDWFQTGGAATSITWSSTGTSGDWATSGGNICFGSSGTEGSGWCGSNFF